jgi:lipoprotein-anchoring transpeptidase ErfK/SrfK
MKKIFLTKKVVRTLIIIIIALVLLTIFFLVRKYINDKRTLEVSKNYTGYLSIDNNNIVDGENDVIDISDFENKIDENSNDINEEKNQDDVNKEKNNNTKQEKINSTPKYYIKINNRANRVNVYGKDSQQNYTVLVKTMICSTGECTPPCSMYPKTKYKMLGNRYQWAKFHSVYVRYPTQIVGGIFFHSVPYLDKRKDSLSYSMFDHLGQSVSAGCIRLKVADAKWIYDNVESGSIVEFNTNVTNNESAPKISSNERCRNWDPTDTDSNNPWKNKANFVENKVNAENNNNDNNNNNNNNNNSNNNNNKTTINDNDKPSTNDNTTKPIDNHKENKTNESNTTNKSNNNANEENNNHGEQKNTTLKNNTKIETNNNVKNELNNNTKTSNNTKNELSNNTL